MPRRKEAPPLPKYMTADEVANLLRISKSRAYKIMRQLNKELEEQGKITTSGRIVRSYLEQRCL